jgi:hypothetical protein
MEKLALQSVIEKYYLDGLIEKVRWIITNRKLNIPLISPNKNLVGEVSFPFEIEDDLEFAIFDTSKLLKVLNIIDKSLIIDFEKNKKIAKKMKISDSSYNFNYTLQDIVIAPQLPEISEPNYEIEFNINEEFSNRFIKAKKALDNSEIKNKLLASISLGCGDFNYIKIKIGMNNDFSDKIEFNHPSNFENEMMINLDILEFPAEELKLILNNNQNGKGYISSEGLMKLVFSDGECNSKYYLTAN